MVDGLVELLIQLVHKISVRAERKVESEINSEFRRVHGKNGILVRLAEAALELPEEIVRKAIYPVVGARTLADIIAEAKADEKAFSTLVRTKLAAPTPTTTGAACPSCCGPSPSTPATTHSGRSWTPWSCSTGTRSPRKSSMTWPTPCHWTTWCPMTGGTRWSTAAPGRSSDPV